LRKDAPIDWLGISCLVVGLGLGEIILERGERADWFASHWVIYCSVAALAALTLLVVQELRTTDPVIELRMLSDRNFTLPVSLVILLTFTLYGTGILNPIFLQELLSYDAQKAGLVMAPRGFGTMFAMLLLGTLSRRGFDTRFLVGIGFALVALAMWEMAGLNLESDTFRIVWPTVLQGVGTGLVFPGLSAAALSSMPRPKMGYAASLYAVTRNLGAAIGTSALTTMLIRQQQVRQSYLVEHVSIFSLMRIPAMGNAGGLVQQLAAGQRQGMVLLYHAVQRQAMMLSFNDIYRMLCVMMLVLVPSFMFLQRDLRNVSADGH
jgi:DHA2 family multidrug resistance protein